MYSTAGHVADVGDHAPLHPAPAGCASLVIHDVTLSRLEDQPGAVAPCVEVVFCTELGEPINPHRITGWFRKYRDAASISVGTAHTLRHTMATTALTEGVPLHIVAARLGDDPRTTLAVCSHVLPSSDSAAAEALARILVDKALTEPAAMAAS